MKFHCILLVVVFDSSTPQHDRIVADQLKTEMALELLDKLYNDSHLVHLPPLHRYKGNSVNVVRKSAGKIIDTQKIGVHGASLVQLLQFCSSTWCFSGVQRIPNRAVTLFKLFIISIYIYIYSKIYIVCN